MSFDTLWPGGPRFLKSGDGFKLSTDSVLLAHFAAPLRAGTIIDLGCGAIAAAFCRCELLEATGENASEACRTTCFCTSSVSLNPFCL